MYIQSNVVYTLANGTQVKTLEEAKKSGLAYNIDYIPVYEKFEISEKVAARRITLP